MTRKERGRKCSPSSKIIHHLFWNEPSLGPRSKNRSRNRHPLRVRCNHSQTVNGELDDSLRVGREGVPARREVENDGKSTLLLRLLGSELNFSDGLTGGLKKGRHSERRGWEESRSPEKKKKNERREEKKSARRV